MAIKNKKITKDQKTANAFSRSWNNLPIGSIYTKEQFKDWLYPLTESDIKGKSVLELGCGNASLMMYMTEWQPLILEGVDLGDSTNSATKNMSLAHFKDWKITKADLVNFTSNGFDVVYCIGVLHHLKEPKKGLDSVIRNVKRGGKFHCWVYAQEGNLLIIYLVDPLRKLASHFPWWLIKYFIAIPLVAPFFIYAKLLNFLPDSPLFNKLPLYQYSRWIAKQNFFFFRHVAFDQLITPQTTYIPKQTIENWLKSYKNIDKQSTYIIMRNGNSWKFGGRIKI